MLEPGTGQATHKPLHELAPRLSMRVGQRTNQTANVIGRSLGADLYAWYGVEAPPRSLRFLTADDLGDDGVTVEDLHEQAAANLWRRLAGVACHRRSARDPFRVYAPEGLAATTLVLEDLWLALADGEVAGDLIVRVANTSAVYFCGSREAEAFDKLAAGATRLFRFTPAGWAHYPLPTVRQAA
ncbi:MAG: hypothetical protein KC635_09315 [Myxococcales bacterium]|nr:hypothetical protein [Myxococcales bacterium]MCB9733971.1 hypothetical protein [Deltaproteobacteria bacterium]